MKVKRKVTPAKGTKGFIMHGTDIEGNRFYFFRVYDKGHIHKFVDYDILHYDLEVEILEDDARFMIMNLDITLIMHQLMKVNNEET